MTLVKIATSYGVGDSRIAPALASALGVPLLGRLPVPHLLGDEAAAADERLGLGGLLSKLASMATARGTPAGMRIEDLLPDEERRREAEEELRRFAARGAGVILGRAAAVVLRDGQGPPHPHRRLPAGVPRVPVWRRRARAGPVPPAARLDRDRAGRVRADPRRGRPRTLG
jgi:hypothetical protein